MQFGHKGKRDSWIDYRVFKQWPKNWSKHGEFVAANEEVISSLVRRVYRAMTEEVPRERSRVSAGNSSNAEEELLRNFQIPVLVHREINIKFLKSKVS